MKTNMLGKIKIAISNLNKSKLNFSHDVSTTAPFGDLQPTTCKLIMPNSNGTIDSKNLVRFGTMLAPTFGRIKAKEYHTLVPFSDLFENMPFVLAQGKKATGDAVIAPAELPNMQLGLLSRYCLIGAEVEVIQHTSTDAAHQTYMLRAESPTYGASIIGQTDFANDVVSLFDFNRTGTGSFAGYQGSMFNLGAFTQKWAEDNGIWNNSSHEFWIPVKNEKTETIVGVHEKQELDSNGVQVTTKYMKHIPIDKSSINITTEINGHTYTFVFRLSSFGKRIRKQIIGAHKQISMCSTEKVELVSLCAIWKAWFDLFGLTLYENYEITPLRQFTQWVCLKNYGNLAFAFTWNQVVNFIVSLGYMYYTDAQDVVSAHTTSTAISPSLGLSSQFIDVDGSAHVSEVNNPDGTNVNGHSFIDAVKHGQLDAEYLMRLYTWCNKNTIAGKEIEKVLRAQGLGKYVDSCKSNFIGYHEELMEISDVVSSADTWDSSTQTGSMLGEYGGRGLKVYKSGRNSFHTDEYAYQVSLFTIVPEAGYLQSIDPTSYITKKTDLFLPDFEAIGMEANRKTLVCGAENWSSQVAYATAGSMDDMFGLAPRGTHLKLAHNIANGDFTLRDTRDGYLRYTMDKFIDVGERIVQKLYEGTNYSRFEVTRELTPSEVPHASLHYRYPCRYPWMGNFARIFAYQGEPRDDDFYIRLAQNPSQEAIKWEFLHNDYDNFIVHMIINLPVYSPCKPIEESFETTLDGGKANAAMEKA